MALQASKVVPTVTSNGFRYFYEVRRRPLKSSYTQTASIRALEVRGLLRGPHGPFEKSVILAYVSIVSLFAQATELAASFVDYTILLLGQDPRSCLAITTICHYGFHQPCNPV